MTDRVGSQDEAHACNPSVGPDGADRSEPSGEMADEAGRGGEGLLLAGDGYWEELTEQTVGLLRRLRTAHRRQQLRSLGYVGYVTVLVVAVYVAPYVGLAVLEPARPATSTFPAAAPVPLAVVAVVLLTMVAAIRDAAWRGPALLDAATVAWLLPTPIRHGRLLRPRLRLALVSAVLLGALVGGVAGVLVRLLSGGSLPRLAVGGSGTGALTGLLALAAAGLAESADGQFGRWLERVGGWLWLPPALLAVVAAAWWQRPAGVGGSVGRTIVAAALWSGPWGWAAGPLAAAVPDAVGDGGSADGWPVAAAAGAALAVGLGLAVLADRRLDRLPIRLLRARAASVSGVSALLWTLQPRRARALVRAAQGRTPSTRLRLPLPGQRILVVAWRDATALLRAPSRLLWGLLWLGVAVALARAGAGIPTSLHTPAERVAVAQHLALTMPGLVALYLAAAQLVEPARLDADDPRAPRGLPLTARALTTWHVVVPLAVLLSGLALATLALLVTGFLGWGTLPGSAGSPGSPAGITETALAAVPMLGAALVSAYRGDVPPWVLVGAPTPVGDTGPAQTVLWYLRGPLVALVMLLPLAVGQAPWWDALVTSVVMLGWARSRAAEELRG